MEERRIVSASISRGRKVIGILRQDGTVLVVPSCPSCQKDIGPDTASIALAPQNERTIQAVMICDFCNYGFVVVYDGSTREYVPENEPLVPSYIRESMAEKQRLNARRQN